MIDEIPFEPEIPVIGILVAYLMIYLLMRVAWKILFGGSSKEEP